MELLISTSAAFITSVIRRAAGPLLLPCATAPKLWFWLSFPVTYRRLLRWYRRLLTPHSSTDDEEEDGSLAHSSSPPLGRTIRTSLQFASLTSPLLLFSALAHAGYLDPWLLPSPSPPQSWCASVVASILHHAWRESSDADDDWKRSWWRRSIFASLPIPSWINASSGVNHDSLTSTDCTLRRVTTYGFRSPLAAPRMEAGQHRHPLLPSFLRPSEQGVPPSPPMVVCWLLSPLLHVSWPHLVSNALCTVVVVLEHLRLSVPPDVNTEQEPEQRAPPTIYSLLNGCVRHCACWYAVFYVSAAVGMLDLYWFPRCSSEESGLLRPSPSRGGTSGGSLLSWMERGVCAASTSWLLKRMIQANQLTVVAVGSSVGIAGWSGFTVMQWMVPLCWSIAAAPAAAAPTTGTMDEVSSGSHPAAHPPTPAKAAAPPVFSCGLLLYSLLAETSNSCGSNGAGASVHRGGFIAGGLIGLVCAIHGIAAKRRPV